jgi:hypothetical protein
MLRINHPVRGYSAGLALAFALTRALSAEPATEGVPSSHEKARYDALRAHSPFSLATAAPVEAAPQASFAANWFVSGIARIGDEDFVTIKSRDQSEQFSLHGRNPVNPNDANSVALMSVNWSEMVGKSTVILRKGTETARLEFNEAEVHAAPPAAPVAAAAAGGPGAVRPPPNTAAARPVAPRSGIPGVPVPVNVPNPNVAAAIHRRAAPIQAPH